MKWTLGKGVVFVAIIMLTCFSSVFAQDTAWVEMRFEGPVWQYTTQNNFSCEIWLKTNAALGGIQIPLKVNRNVVVIDSVKAAPTLSCALVTIGKANDSLVLGEMTSFVNVGGAYLPIPGCTQGLQDGLDAFYHYFTIHFTFKDDSLASIQPPNTWMHFTLDTVTLPTSVLLMADIIGHSFGDGDSILVITDTAQLNYNKVNEIRPGNIPSEFELNQNFPNPFNPTTVIEFAVPSKSTVHLAVFNVMGQKVRTLVDEELDVGWKSVTWDGTDDAGNSVASGIYLYRVEAGDYTDSKKMMMVK
jgi:FlgD Ig-like domain